MDAPACYFDLYRDQKLTPPALGDWEDDEALRREGRIFDSGTGPIDPALIRQAQVGYYACITHLDHQIGRLLQALMEYELAENTVVLFVADHGEELCDHHRFRKALPYEGSCRIPLILSGNPALTGITPHTVCHGLAELRDILPTLLDIAGGTVPETVEGTSLLPAARGDGKLRDWLHGEHSYGESSNHFIVTQRDKYCWFSATGREQYFQLDRDPHELHDRIAEPRCRERIEELRAHLIHALKDRPEGFVQNGRLIPGQNYPPYIQKP